MKVEICDLCYERVSALNKTTVTIEDYKGISFELNGVFPDKRKFKGVICDKCLNRLRNSDKKE